MKHFQNCKKKGERNDKTLTPPESHKGHTQDTFFQSQKEKVSAALYRQPMTMLMVSVETGIYRANVCRHIAKLRKQDCIQVAKKGICPVSKYRAGFYTTNPELFKDPSINEPTLF